MYQTTSIRKILIFLKKKTKHNSLHVMRQISVSCYVNPINRQKNRHIESCVHTRASKENMYCNF